MRSIGDVVDGQVASDFGAIPFRSRMEEIWWKTLTAAPISWPLTYEQEHLSGYLPDFRVEIEPRPFLEVKGFGHDEAKQKIQRSNTKRAVVLLGSGPGTYMVNNTPFPIIGCTFLPGEKNQWKPAILRRCGSCKQVVFSPPTACYFCRGEIGSERGADPKVLEQSWNHFRDSGRRDRAYVQKLETERTPLSTESELRCRGLPQIFLHASEKRVALMWRSLGDRAENLFIVGPNGVGKSFLAAVIARKNQNIFRWCFVPDLLLEVKRSYSKFAERSERKILEDLLSPRLLILDDLFAAHQTDFGFATVGWILNKRLEQNMPTVVTSDRTLKEISQRDSSVASRIATFRMVRMAGKDRRIPEGGGP